MHAVQQNADAVRLRLVTPLHYQVPTAPACSPRTWRDGSAMSLFSSEA
jgi:hypothetical protein